MLPNPVTGRAVREMASKRTKSIPFDDLYIGQFQISIAERILKNGEIPALPVFDGRIKCQREPPPRPRGDDVKGITLRLSQCICRYLPGLIHIVPTRYSLYPVAQDTSAGSCMDMAWDPTSSAAGG